MDFKFNVNRLLPRNINKVTQSLIPEDFRGDRRELNEYQRQLSRILDEMGEASARAQGLNKPITSAMKLRDTDHIVYFLVDSAGNGGLGTVVGLLKTGSKNLFMFDEAGVHYQLQPRCVLDFYIHETRQRMGLGKDLYQHMLTEERIRPVKLAIDRPSEKFLQFLYKHYGLTSIIPQNNKFVVFQGFFDDESQDLKTKYTLPSRNSVESTYGNNNINKPSSASSSNGHSSLRSAVPRSSYGRYAAARPPCSMANIIHNTPIFGQAAEHTGDIPATAATKLERPRSLSLYSEEERLQYTNVPIAAESQIQEFANEIPIEPNSESMSTSKEPTCSKKLVKSSGGNPNYVSAHSDENKATSSIKASPSCAQEVSGNQSVHLDLKFYHSPLW